MMKKMKDVFSIIRNGVSIKQNKNANGLPITRIESISNRFLDLNKMGYADIFDNTFEDYYLKNGDILMSHINSLKHLGKTAIVDNIKDLKIIHGMNLLILRSSDKLYPQFANYYFQTNKFYNEILKISNQSVNQSSFSISKLKNIQIPLPNLATQKAIAARLDLAEKVKNLNQQLLAKYDALAQSIFLELFGDPVVNEKGWEVKKIFNLVKKTHKINKKYSKRTIDYVDISSIDNKLNVIASTSSYKLENRPSRAQQILEKGDILFSTVRPNLKNIAINNFEKELIGSTGFFVFRTKEDYIQSLFLFYLLLNNSTTSFFNSIVSGANYPAIKNSDLNKMKIIVPPLPLQTEFARRIENIEKQKELLRREIQKSEELFESLLQESFSFPSFSKKKRGRFDAVESGVFGKA